MSYDISLVDPQTGQEIEFEMPLDIKGGTYALGGTRKAWLNVTWNYSPHFYRTMGERGIRTIYGMTGLVSIPVLDAAIAQLAADVDEDYWKPTEGNARAALINLRQLATLCPMAVWQGD